MASISGPELLARMVRDSTSCGTVVLDAVAWSAALLACERLGRRARLVELDPRCCDVIAERYHRLVASAGAGVV